MVNFKTCDNGHNYNADLYSVCPFCPPTSNPSDYEKTLMDFKNTQSFNEGKNQQFNKTMINEETIDFKKTPVNSVANVEHPFKRTSIGTNENTGAIAPLEQTKRRKLVGWLVTFSNDEYGQDYKIFAGKNKIGSVAGSDILINDQSVSGEHTIILYRDNDYLIKDNFSTNGTKVNGLSVDEGKLKDGDEIKLGNTILKFKTVF